MNTNYREILGIPNLRTVHSMYAADLNAKQKKAIRNIKYCANDQWQFVNSWYDHKCEDSRQFMMNPSKLFDTIYSESLENVYDEGMCSFGSRAKSYLKDIRFCGKEFLQKTVLYYTAKLLEESVPEVDGTDADAERVAQELMALKTRIGI